MNKKLKQIFDYYNEKYWDGKLPPLKCSFSKKVDDDECLGLYISPDSKEEDIPENYAIYISPTQKLKEVRETMLHEMCHHAVFLQHKEKYWKKRLSWHGTYWRNEMERVGFKRPIRSTT